MNHHSSLRRPWAISIVLGLLFFSPVFADKSQLLQRAEEILDSKIEYYLFKDHDLHPEQIKIIRKQGVVYANIKKKGTEKDKLQFLLNETVKLINSLNEKLKEDPKRQNTYIQLQLSIEQAAKLVTEIEQIY